MSERPDQHTQVTHQCHQTAHRHVYTAPDGHATHAARHRSVTVSRRYAGDSFMWQDRVRRMRFRECVARITKVWLSHRYAGDNVTRLHASHDKSIVEKMSHRSCVRMSHRNTSDNVMRSRASHALYRTCRINHTSVIV